MADQTPLYWDAASGKVRPLQSGDTINVSLLSNLPTTLSGYGITDAQPLDATLTALAGLTVSANLGIYATGTDLFTTYSLTAGGRALGGVAGTADTFPYFSSANTVTLGSLTAAGRALLDDADNVAQRSTLGLGTLATQSGTFSGTSSGTNTGDQTITLTGNVTGSGTGSFATTIATGVVTMAMMANVATGTIFYRKTASTGVPEVQTLATLKTDLGLTGTNSGDQTTITGNAGSATVLQTARTINGVSFNGSANITVTAATPNALTFGNGLISGTYTGASAQSVVLGTPGDTTLSSTSAVTSTSHTHAFTPGGSTAQYIRGDGSLATFPTVGSGTVTSVAAGNGLNFTTITGSGSVTLGTPGTLTGATTNAVTTTSHTHDITNYDLTFGNGLASGSFNGLSAVATVTLGTPSTITGTSTNSVSATSHTHLINVSYNPALAADAATTYASDVVSTGSIVAGGAISGAVHITGASNAYNRVLQLYSNPAGGSSVPDLYFRTSHTTVGGGGWTGTQKVYHDGNLNLAAIDTAQGFRSVQNGTGAGQLSNGVKLGWSGTEILAQVDSTAMGAMVTTLLTQTISGTKTFSSASGVTAGGTGFQVTAGSYSKSGSFGGTDRTGVALVNTSTAASSSINITLQAGSGAVNQIGTQAPEYTAVPAFTGKMMLIAGDSGIGYSAESATATHTWYTGTGRTLRMSLLSTGLLDVVGNITASTLYSDQSFLSNGTNIILANNGSAGGVFLRPNGNASATGQAALNSAGNFSTSSLTLSGAASIGGLTTGAGFASDSATLGYSMGSRVAASPTTVTAHVALYGTTYGFSITGNALNYVVPASASHYFYVASTPRVGISATGLDVNGVVSDARGDVRSIPGRVASGSGNFSVTDLNSCVEKTVTTALAWTIMPSWGVHGDMVTISNQGTSGNITVTRGSGVSLYRNGVNADVIVAPGSVLTIMKASAANRWTC